MPGRKAVEVRLGLACLVVQATQGSVAGSLMPEAVVGVWLQKSWIRIQDKRGEEGKSQRLHI